MVTQMNSENRSRRAVLISITKSDQGHRISIDDAVSDDGLAKTWAQREHVTNKLMTTEAFEKMEFDEKELADFGHYILARLNAFLKRNENQAG
jgi:hypothetical protein